MRYRKLDANGDYVFGQQQDSFWIDVPAGVAQAVQTALLLFAGEWFLDLTAGVPWMQNVLGPRAQGAYDTVIQNAIINVEGVMSIDSYSSTLDPTTRALSVNAAITTAYGPATVQVTL